MKLHPYLPIAVALCLTLGCTPPRLVPNVTPTYTAVDSSIPVADSEAAAEIEATVAPYRAQLGAEMNRVVAQLARPLTKGSPESSLGNFVADLTYAAAVEAFPNREIAFAIQNSGGLRISTIDAGPLLVSQLYELMPFDNELVLVALAGTQVEALVKHVIAKGGWPISEQVRITKRGEALDIRLNGQPLAPGRTYYVATNDYVANGGDDTAVLAAAPQETSGRLVRDVLIEQVGRVGTPIQVDGGQGRIQLID